MVMTNLEINFQRLLSKTEELAENQKDFSNNWRFDKYTSSLEEYLKNLNNLSACKPSIDTLKDYSKRVEFLKQICELNKPKPSIGQSSNQQSVKDSNQLTKLNNPGPIISKKDVKPKQIYHKTKLNQETMLRNELFSTSSNKSSSNKDNDLKNEQQQIQDINKILSKQQETQEKVANQMLKSVKAIKENSLLANRIIKSDNKLLSDLNMNAEKNSDNLKQVNDHLSARVSRSCLGSCWIWVVVFLIMVVFIMMVLFMKLFPKKKYSSQETPIDDFSTYKHFINNNTILIGNESIHTLEL